ncbi:hypothetical protein U9M48_037911 [Paspalum notatum var. saurae]|uniref:Uncharacterized protein n=1 Tax=Paspalum notatum var. saurae TaxID=547442 RepID=A0AAQ3UGL9_PASNO
MGAGLGRGMERLGRDRSNGTAGDLAQICVTSYAPAPLICSPCRDAGRDVGSSDSDQRRESSGPPPRPAGRAPVCRDLDSIVRKPMDYRVLLQSRERGLSSPANA